VFNQDLRQVLFSAIFDLEVQHYSASFYFWCWL